MTPPAIELLASLPIDQRHGRHCELKITRVVNGSDPVFAIGIFSTVDQAAGELGIVIGLGPSRTAALCDAQDTLQAALDSVDVAILKGARS
jgi:hypothetical protein